jgi:hypothetical protein
VPTHTAAPASHVELSLSTIWRLEIITNPLEYNGIFCGSAMYVNIFLEVNLSQRHLPQDWTRKATLYFG